MIAIQVIIIMIPRIFLNHPSPSLMILSFLISFFQKNAILPTANHNPKAYNTILIVHVNKDNGNMVAMMSVYVGEQVVNIGPNDAHRRICQQIL
jgi:hypothetical protein